MLEFKRAVREELPELIDIVAGAREFLRAGGVNQWQGQYPTLEILERDIDRGELFRLKDGNDIAGMLVITYRPQPWYDTIYDGAWPNNEPYAAIHRVAVADNSRRTGAASVMLEIAEGLIRERGCMNVRIDTHRDNAPMRGMLEKNGYRQCGKISVSPTESDRERLAYYKILTRHSCCAGCGGCPQADGCGSFDS